MNDTEFGKLLHAAPPLALRPGWIESFLLPHYSALTLDREGFTVAIPFSRRRYRWDEISPLRYGNVGWGLVRGVSEKKVFFDCRLPENATFIDRLFFIKSIWLPYNYGLGAFKLAQLMNHWRERALTGVI